MRLRTAHTVNGQRPAPQAVIKVWGSTSGGGTPTLDSPSWGSSSITDAGVGILDVTFSRAFASATSYVVMVAIKTATGNMLIQSINNSTAPTATAVRIAAGNQTEAQTDPSVGYEWIIYGI